jgi:CBS domain containing-hemolysin-like protein
MNTLYTLHLLASADTTALVKEWHFSGGQVLWYVFVILFFVLLNGFFVASEFALVKVRESQLQAAQDEKRRGASMARHQVAHLDAYLSATQLGITLSSLALGMLGEPYIAAMLQPLLHMVGVTSDATLHAVSVGCAYAIMTFLHVVVGELTPKSLAIRKALDTTLVVAPLMQFFYVVLKPAIFLLNGAANLMLRYLFGLKPASDHERAHSEEELRHIVSETQKSEVTDTEKDILLNVLGLNDRTVRDVMTPRNMVAWLDVEDSFTENLKKAVTNKHTRYPVVEGHLDRTLGMVHVKDLLKGQAQGITDIRQVMREMLEVPELVVVDRLLKTFLKEKQHIALVIDEHGGAAGIVTLDNVLERIVGDIQDEFDNEKPRFRQVTSDEFVVHGLYNINDLCDQTDLEIEQSDVTTVGGYVTHLLGHLPQEGDKVTIGDYEAEVTKADARRVLRVDFHRLNRKERHRSSSTETEED